MFGSHGNFLQVDMDTQETAIVTIKEDDQKNFIGGCGLAAKLLYPMMRADISPLSSDNPLFFSVGPFTGTQIPSVSRYAVCSISPQTHIWGEATSGGIFPHRLKLSGFDGILITGKSETPSYLYVHDGIAEIREASHLWGKDTYETQNVIKGEIEDGNVSVACIGPAGERLVKFACIINDGGRAAGRCGLGAVMGSKNLKAIAVRGNKKVAPSYPEKLRELVKEIREGISANFVSTVFREHGTMIYTDMGTQLGDVPVKYFTKGLFPFEKVTSAALKGKYTVEPSACYGCPIACGRVVKNFRKELSVIDGPEYETVAAFGPLCMNSDLDSIIYANHFCNTYGLDTISAGVTIALVMFLYDKGIITKEALGREALWGDRNVIQKLLEMIVNREGIGDLLAEGSQKVIEEYGIDPEESACVKGLEIPMHEPRAFTGSALTYATSPRGACHLRGDYYGVDMGRGAPELDIPAGDRFQSEGKAELVARYQNFRDVFDSLLLCKFAPITLTQISELLTSITGFEYSPAQVCEAGERSFNLKRAINCTLGVSKNDDRLPGIVTKPLEEGSAAGKVPDMELLLNDYYEARKWDKNTGKPCREKLVELGLEHTVHDI